MSIVAAIALPQSQAAIARPQSQAAIGRPDDSNFEHERRRVDEVYTRYYLVAAQDGACRDQSCLEDSVAEFMQMAAEQRQKMWAG